MAEQVFAGIDLAWNTNAATGIAVVDDTGVLLDSATLRTDDQIIAWMSRPDWALGYDTDLRLREVLVNRHSTQPGDHRGAGQRGHSCCSDPQLASRAR